MIQPQSCRWPASLRLTQFCYLRCLLLSWGTLQAVWSSLACQVFGTAWANNQVWNWMVFVHTASVFSNAAAHRRTGCLAFISQKMAHLDLRLVPAPWMGVHIQESTRVVGRITGISVFACALLKSPSPFPFLLLFIFFFFIMFSFSLSCLFLSPSSSGLCFCVCVRPSL